MNAVSLIEDILLTLCLLSCTLSSVCWDTTHVDEREAGRVGGALTMLNYSGTMIEGGRKGDREGGRDRVGG